MNQARPEHNGELAFFLFLLSVAGLSISNAYWCSSAFHLKNQMTLVPDHTHETHRFMDMGQTHCQLQAELSHQNLHGYLVFF